MRLSASLLLPFFALLFSAADAQAQLDLPVADYKGSLKLGITCPDGTTSKLKTKGLVSIEGQSGANILVAAEFVGVRSGVDCTVTLELMGVVNDFGRVSGTYTSSIACSDGTTTLGSGDFDGRYTPGRLAFLLEGLDDGCALFGAFKGKGSPGSALCAALTHKAITKLSKKVYGAWSKFFKFAQFPTSMAAVQTIIEGAEQGFAKASEKISKKVEKAGGSCSQVLTPPSNITTRMKLDTIVPMSAGFNKNRVIDRITRSRIAKMQGRYFAARLKTESIFILKLDPLKRAAALEKARNAFVDKTVKLLTKVTGLGLDWTGPGPQVMANDIDDLTAQLVQFFE